MSSRAEHEAEWLTRKRRIDPKLDGAGWPRPRAGTIPLHQPFRSEEEETKAGPADYVLWQGNQPVGIVEAKKVTVGPQNVLTQAERYARGLTRSGFDFDGFRCPFLYATNGELIWFHDVRNSLNRSRQVADFHTPAALTELLGRDLDGACERLLQLPNDNARLRPYQRAANVAIEAAIAERKRHLLVAMATGTGKTFTLVNQVYRLMKTGVTKRVLFLVDRRALAAQAVRAFSSYEAEPGQKFDQIYEVYSSRFHREDFGEEDSFDPKVLPTTHLTDPKAGDAFVYVCTIQRMAINLFGRQVIFETGEEPLEDDEEHLAIPIHAFDLVVADECHRGYTSGEVSLWRNTLDHFDAVKIGLTATPASHTTAYFQQKVFEYGYEQAVRDGFLVDYDVVNVRSDVRLKGVFLKEGEHVEVVDPETGVSQLDLLEDERSFDTSEVESRVTAPDSNRRILEEVKKYAAEHEQQYGRFPKTLIFAVNDLPHTSHADQLTELAREVFGQGEGFVRKITGRVDRPLQWIREFRNRPTPGIVVTVDLLTTGIDIPDLEFIVFLRLVKSRILFEQMLGRGTRKGVKFPDKSHFTVFDCFDGTLLQYFKSATSITAEPPIKPTRTIPEVLEDVWNNRDRDYNIACLVKRLQRIDKEMAGEARPLFAAYIPEGDLATYARGLPGALQTNFVDTMKLLRTRSFQDLLVHYPRPPRQFLRATGYEDQVTSGWLIRDGVGRDHKPDDYLAAFTRYVLENESQIQAIRILLDRPREWSASALSELRQKLAYSDYHFTIDRLTKAHELCHHKALVDIISMVKHAANEAQPLLTAPERVERAFVRVTAGHSFTAEQQHWLSRIREVMQQNLSIDREDFDYQAALADAGGWGAARRVFGDERLSQLLHHLNEAIAA